MAICQVARPFSLRVAGQRLKYRYGVGVYTIDDALAAHSYVQHHLQAAIVAKGEALVQHRQPQMSWYGGSVWYRSLSIVQNIEPQQVLIWRWPLLGNGGADFPWHAGEIEPAPGAMLLVAARHTKEDGTEEWRGELREAPRMSVPDGYYQGHGTPVAVEPNPFASFGPTTVGDCIVFGEMSATPFVLDRWPPAFPPEAPEVRQARLLQERAVAAAQSGSWRPSPDPGPTIQDLTRQVVRSVPRAPTRASARAWVEGPDGVVRAVG
jgi:hypothetical protein